MTQAPLFFVPGAVAAAVQSLLATEGAWRGPAPRITSATVGVLRDAMLAGERPDAAILSAEAMEDVTARGLLARESIVTLGRTGIGIAARTGFESGQIDTPAAMIAAFEAARSIAWPDPARGATAGKHFVAVIEQAGVAAMMAQRSRLFAAGIDAVTACQRGEVDLVVTQASEIVGRAGLRMLGMLPPPYTRETTYCIAAAPGSSAAGDIIASMTSPAARRAIAAIGFEVVG